MVTIYLWEVILYKTILISLLFIYSCSISTEPKTEIPFKWVKEGTVFRYNYYSDLDTVRNALEMKVIKTNPNIYESPLKVDWFYPQWDVVYAHQLVSDDYTVYRESDGIYSTAPIDCGKRFDIIKPKFKYLLIPKKPILGMELFTYFCKNKINQTHTIIAIDSVIKTPLGDFSTFIMQEEFDDTTKIRSFWNENSGLIKIEKGNFNTNKIITYDRVK